MFVFHVSHTLVLATQPTNLFQLLAPFNMIRVHGHFVLASTICQPSPHRAPPKPTASQVCVHLQATQPCETHPTHTNSPVGMCRQTTHPCDKYQARTNSLRVATAGVATAHCKCLLLLHIAIAYCLLLLPIAIARQQAIGNDNNNRQ